MCHFSGNKTCWAICAWCFDSCLKSPHKKKTSYVCASILDLLPPFLLNLQQGNNVYSEAQWRSHIVFSCTYCRYCRLFMRQNSMKHDKSCLSGSRVAQPCNLWVVLFACLKCKPFHALACTYQSYTWIYLDCKNNVTQTHIYNYDISSPYDARTSYLQ